VPSLRDEVVCFITRWATRLELPLRQLLAWLELFPSRFYDWQKRYGKANEHNGLIPKNHWLLPWEKQTILDYTQSHPGEGYRRLAFMMLDDNVAAVSPSSVYRVLKSTGLLQISEQKISKKGHGFDQPIKPHEHWHIDVSYINIACTFYYLCSILDGYSRFIVHWALLKQMKESDIEIILQRALEKHPATPRIISDNGPQFIANDFKEFIRTMEMSHVRTSPHYPQSNGKLERYHRTIKSECVRQAGWNELEQASAQIGQYVNHYNTKRLHSALGYVTPFAKLQGHEEFIFARRQQQLREARYLRMQVLREYPQIMGG
jgi:putative transposase